MDPAEPEEETASAAEQPVEEEIPQKATNPIGYAQYQGEIILQEAKNQAEEIIRQAQAQAQQEIQQLRQQATEEGFQAGFQKGVEQGTMQALEENRKTKAELSRQQTAEMENFLNNAEQALNKQLDDNIDELRDLAIAIAEKVICVSLKSSADVIGRMIQTAVDKRKRREWAHVYIAECDARRLNTLPPALANALSELSDRVRIIPMADDESGTCIIELPDAIIDASAATQLQNVRELLNVHATGTAKAALLYETEGK